MMHTVRQTSSHLFSAVLRASFRPGGDSSDGDCAILLLFIHYILNIGIQINHEALSPFLLRNDWRSRLHR